MSFTKATGDLQWQVGGSSYWKRHVTFFSECFGHFAFISCYTVEIERETMSREMDNKLDCSSELTVVLSDWLMENCEELFNIRRKRPPRPFRDDFSLNFHESHQCFKCLNLRILNVDLLYLEPEAPATPADSMCQTRFITVWYLMLFISSSGCIHRLWTLVRMPQKCFCLLSQQQVIRDLTFSYVYI